MVVVPPALLLAERLASTDHHYRGGLMDKTSGGCLCGGVRFELTEPASAAGYCHCTRCQRRAGGATSAQARIDGRTFRLTRGEDLVKAWRHPDGGF